MGHGRAFRAPASAALLVCVSALAGAPVRAGPAAIEIVEFGEFEAWDEGSRQAPDTTKGSIASVAESRLVRRTTCIPARPGVRFGIRTRLALPIGGREVRFEIEHPPFRLPDGRQPTREAWSSLLTGEPQYYGWRFDEPYELVQGRWTMTIVLDGHVAARQVFEVVGPEDRCAAEVS